MVIYMYTVRNIAISTVEYTVFSDGMYAVKGHMVIYMYNARNIRIFTGECTVFREHEHLSYICFFFSEW